MTQKIAESQYVSLADIPQAFSATVQEEQGRPVVKVRGEIDLATTPELLHSIEAARSQLAGSPLAFVDLRDAQFIDLFGAQTLIEQATAMRELGGELRLVVPGQGPAARIFELLEIDQTIRLHHDLVIPPDSPGAADADETGGVDLTGETADTNGQTDHQPDHRRLWERYMDIERKELEDRRNGELAKALGPALPGEFQEELDRLAREDREKAEEGLAVLRQGEKVWYKHIDELTLEDRPARIEAQRRRLAWVGGRLSRLTAP